MGELLDCLGDSFILRSQIGLSKDVKENFYA